MTLVCFDDLFKCFLSLTSVAAALGVSLMKAQNCGSEVESVTFAFGDPYIRMFLRY